ncbi:WD40-repeat-containing domain protein [Crassisporium funariophilum]|nr:WD40-repeat-containing domain protein [Crassisporium funariophilum]
MHSASRRQFDEHDISGVPLETPSLGNYNPNNIVSMLQHPTSASMTQSPTLYIPIASPPTPAPSPGPIDAFHQQQSQNHPYQMHPNYPTTPFPPFAMNSQNPAMRRQFLTCVLNSCTPFELLYISQTINPLLKRDFLYSLPPELALNILSFIDEPETLLCAAQVSRHWRSLLRDEGIWRRMCFVHGFDDWDDVLEPERSSYWRNRWSRTSKGKQKQEDGAICVDDDSDVAQIQRRHSDTLLKDDPALEWLSENKGPTMREQLGVDATASPKKDTSSSSAQSLELGPRDIKFSYRRHFKTSYIIRMNWRKGGSLLRAHRLPIVSPDNGTVTSLALDADWVVIGLANSRIKVFSARTGVLFRTLVGHESGVWGVCLVSKGGYRLPEHNGQDKAEGSSRTGEGSRIKRKDKRKDKERDFEAVGSHVDEDAGDGADGEETRERAMPMEQHIKESENRKTRKASRKKFSKSSPLLASMEILALKDEETNSENPHHILPSAMRTALGLDMTSDSEATSCSEDGGSSGSMGGVFDEDAAERKYTRRQHRKVNQTAIDEEEEEDQSQDWQVNPGKSSTVCYASQGWGQPSSLIVSGGCDKVLRVWEAKTGHCIYILHGHTSTIRSLRVLHNRPIAVTGSRDTTVRVWDIQRGRCLRVLEGHHQSVRCLDVCGNKVVSGSYDTTCRVWDVDTGECLHVLQGHFHQIYSVAMDGVRIASGGLDTTVRVWDAHTGQCLALLQGHTALVCQLQLSPTILATGGSDGRVITFCLETYTALHRIAAHDSSVTSLQFDKDFLVTGGNDGRVRLFETGSGNYVRDLSDPGESVWKVAFVKDTCAVMLKRAGKTVVEIWSLKPNSHVHARGHKRPSEGQDGAG